jgi:hypothetical protein
MATTGPKQQVISAIVLWRRNRGNRRVCHNQANAGVSGRATIFVLCKAAILDQGPASGSRVDVTLITTAPSIRRPLSKWRDLCTLAGMCHLQAFRTLPGTLANRIVLGPCSVTGTSAQRPHDAERPRQLRSRVRLARELCAVRRLGLKVSRSG